MRLSCPLVHCACFWCWDSLSWGWCWRILVVSCILWSLFASSSSLLSYSTWNIIYYMTTLPQLLLHLSFPDTIRTNNNIISNSAIIKHKMPTSHTFQILWILDSFPFLFRCFCLWVIIIWCCCISTCCTCWLIYVWFLIISWWSCEVWTCMPNFLSWSLWRSLIWRFLFVSLCYFCLRAWVWEGCGWLRSGIWDVLGWLCSECWGL